MEETASKEIYEEAHGVMKELLTENSLRAGAVVTFNFAAKAPSVTGVYNSTAKALAGAQFDRNQLIRDVNDYSKVKVKKIAAVSFSNESGPCDCVL